MPACQISFDTLPSGSCFGEILCSVLGEIVERKCRREGLSVEMILHIKLEFEALVIRAS
jgi:hypothetical protein